MPSPTLLPVLALALGGCRFSYTVTSTNTSPEQAHYVIVRANSRGYEKVYDCMSMPDGQNWEPVCVQVDMRGKVPDGLDQPRDIEPQGMVWLVQPGESQLAMMALASRGDGQGSGDGPRISVASPATQATVTGPVTLDLTLAAGANGLPINPDSFKVTYLKGEGIDVTERVRGYLAGGRLLYRDAILPAGRHAFEVYVEDSEQNASWTVLDFTVQ